MSKMIAISLTFFFTFFFTLQIVASGMISTSREMSNSKPCELEKALNFIIKENTIIPCRFSSVRRVSSELNTFGIVDVVFHCLILPIMLVFGSRQFKDKDSETKLILIRILYITVSVFDKSHTCIFTIS